MNDFKVAGTRASIKHIHRKFGEKPLVGAEIGVFQGQHAQSILNVLNMKKLYLIDTWDFFHHWKENHTTPRWREGGTPEKIGGEKMYREVCQRFGDRKEDIIIFRGHSLNAAKCLVIKKELDFVYIDGEHTHQAVLNDLRAWWPLVKKGGVVAGHDYTNIPEVKKAVDEFAKEMNVKIQTDYGVDFWIDKRGEGQMDKDFLVLLEKITELIKKCKGVHGLNKTEYTNVLRYLYKTEMRYDAVEIGTWNGITTVSMAMIAKHFNTGKKVFGIDNFIWPLGTSKGKEALKNFNYNIDIFEVRNYCELIIGRSEEVVFNRKIGFLFIDGGHSYEQVKMDIEKYVPLVVSGGYAVFHDYNISHPQTCQAIDEAKLGGDNKDCKTMYVCRSKKC